MGSQPIKVQVDGHVMSCHPQVAEHADADADADTSYLPSSTHSVTISNPMSGSGGASSVRHSRIVHTILFLPAALPHHPLFPACLLGREKKREMLRRRLQEILPGFVTAGS